VQGNQAVLAELGVAHHQQLVLDVEILVIKGDRLTDPQAFSQGPWPVA
jgi:hypothetical protein